uniref:C2H2-type domain-containing protein n=1 Tax=Anopheles atroparvus TaxID=41427 RepID=A0AAG5DUK0_ANOAO
MDSMSFDYDHYFSEETFIIDDFDEFCDDIVRIASASTQYLCKEFDNELRHESPPPGSFVAENRCFEKEVPSLFSEMEYLTEVSPETDATLPEQKPVPIVVNPTEISCKSQDQTLPNTYVEESPPNRPESVIESMPIAGKPPEEPLHDTNITGNLTDPTDYQRILNNYIQKGRRKLEASSYSKMKATCLAKERMDARSTSLVETVTVSSLVCRARGTALPAPSTVASNKLPGHCTTNTATARRLPFATTSDTGLPHTAEKIQVPEGGPARQLPPCTTLRHSLLSRPAASSLKTTRTYLCQDCNVSFPSGELLRKHDCIIAEQYECHLCLREFKKRKTLDHHMKSHDKVFSTDDDLRKEVQRCGSFSHP